jgi:hypothetical protein
MKIIIGGEVGFIFEYFHKALNYNDIGVHR